MLSSVAFYFLPMVLSGTPLRTWGTSLRTSGNALGTQFFKIFYAHTPPCPQGKEMGLLYECLTISLAACKVNLIVTIFPLN
jgi:hypothetical protein